MKSLGSKRINGSTAEVKLVLWTDYKKKLYHFVSGAVGMSYSPSINEDTRDCYFD